MTTFIINPEAGFGRAKNAWARARPELRRFLGPFEESFTSGPGHGSELAREAILSGAKKVVAFGGDGTFREVVEGFMSLSEEKREEAALACFPAGSGCDFARHMGYPGKPEEMASLLSRGKIRRLDLIRARVASDEGKEIVAHLSNMAAFGLGGEVAGAVSRTGKPAGGRLSYLFATLAAILRSKARDYEIFLDGKPLPSGRFHAVILANTSSTGGGMKIAPRADAEDGLFEVLTVGEMSKMEMLLRFPRIYSGSHLGVKGIELYRGRKLEAGLRDDLKGSSRAPLNLDGEALGRLPASFEILPRALPVLAP